MTEHRAMQAVRAVQAALLDANTRAGANVEIGRTSAIEEGDAIDVNVGPEAVIQVDNLRIEASLTLYVDLHTRGIEHEEDVVAQMYELVAQAHAALLADPTLGLAFVTQVKYAGTETFQSEASGDRLGSRRTLWEIEYWMMYANPAT